MLICLSTASLSAIDSGLFDYDQATVEAKFQELDQLEAMLKADPNLEFEELRSHELAEKIRLSEQPMLNTASNDPLGNIPAFLFGCVLGVAGLIVVYIISKEKEDIQMALWGCIVGTVVQILIITLLVSNTAAF